MLGEIDGILKFPPTEEEVQLAKDQILNAEVFEYESRAGILGRRMTLDYYNYPADFLEQLNRKIRTVTPADVTAAWKKNLNPKNLKIVAVGNEKAFDKALSTFGPVTTLDLSIPEAKGKATPVSADASAKGAKAVDALLAKSVGATRGSRSRPPGRNTSSSATKARVRRSPAREGGARPPNKTRSDLEIETPMGAIEIVRVVTPEDSWLQAPNPQTGESSLQTIPAGAAEADPGSPTIRVHGALSSLAAGDYQASLDDGKLVIADHDAMLATVTLDGTGRVATIEYPSMGGATGVRTLSDYKESGGLLFPFTIKVKDGPVEQESTIQRSMSTRRSTRRSSRSRSSVSPESAYFEHHRRAVADL